MIIPGLPLVDVILVAESLDGVLLAMILISTLSHDQRRERWMGEHVNGRVRNVIAGDSPSCSSG